MENIKSFLTKKILNKIILILSFFLSYIIPKKNNLYIFWSVNWQEYSWNSRFLYEYIKEKEKNIDTLFLTKSKELIKNNHNFIYSYSIKWYFSILRAKYIFINNYVYDININPNLIWKFSIINLWHWEPLKKIEFSSNMIIEKLWFFTKILRKIQYKYNYKMWICCSDFSKDNLSEAFLNKNFIITWLPRNDIFFKKKKEIKREKFNILYAPTFRDSEKIINAFSKKTVIELNEICNKNNYNFYIKLHPNNTWIKNIDEKYKNIKIINDIDVQELLIETDLLITDYSSIYIDFLLTKKPIIFYAYDLDKYLKTNREMYINYENAIIKEWLVEKEDELLNLINDIKSLENNKYQKKYIKILNFFHKHKKWWYCKRVFNELKNIWN